MALYYIKFYRILSYYITKQFGFTHKYKVSMVRIGSRANSVRSDTGWDVLGEDMLQTELHILVNHIIR